MVLSLSNIQTVHTHSFVNGSGELKKDKKNLRRFFLALHAFDEVVQGLIPRLNEYYF